MTIMRLMVAAGWLALLTVHLSLRLTFSEAMRLTSLQFCPSEVFDPVNVCIIDLLLRISGFDLSLTAALVQWVMVLLSAALRVV